MSMSSEQWDMLVEDMRAQVAAEIAALLAAMAPRDKHNYGTLAGEKPDYKVVAIRLQFYTAVDTWLLKSLQAEQKYKETGNPKYKMYAEFFLNKAAQVALSARLGDKLMDLFSKLPNVLIPKHSRIPRQDTFVFDNVTFFGIKDRVEKEGKKGKAESFIEQLTKKLKKMNKKIQPPSEESESGGGSS